jgi:hypothetical protein
MIRRKKTLIRQLKTNEVASILSQMVKKQDNKCAICGQYFTQRDYAVLDHSHDTGFIRGALHNSCNGTEGKIKVRAKFGHSGVSSENYLIGLGKYLEQHKTPRWNFIHPLHLSDDEKRLVRNKKARVTRAKAKTK